MKLLVDVNLSPSWVEFLVANSFDAIHWASVGDPGAPDPALMEWAREHGHVVFTHDLDFSRILALTHATGPSVLQVRTADVLPSAIGDLVIRALRQHGEALRTGAVLVLDAASSRARILPI